MQNTTRVFLPLEQKTIWILPFFLPRDTNTSDTSKLLKCKRMFLWIIARVKISQNAPSAQFPLGSHVKCNILYYHQLINVND